MRHLMFGLALFVCATVSVATSPAADPPKGKRQTICLDGQWQVAEGSREKRPERFAAAVPVPGLGLLTYRVPATLDPPQIGARVVVPRLHPEGVEDLVEGLTDGAGALLVGLEAGLEPADLGLELVRHRVVAEEARLVGPDRQDAARDLLRDAVGEHSLADLVEADVQKETERREAACQDQAAAPRAGGASRHPRE